MALEVCNELSTRLVRLTFYDEDDQLVVPTCVMCRLDEVKGGRAVRALAESTETLATDMDYEVLSTENAIYGDDPLQEFRCLTTLFSYGTNGAKSGVGQHIYKIVNLQFVETP